MSNKRSTLLVSAAALVLGLVLQNGPVKAETVDLAVEAALNHHPTVEAAVANRDAYIQERKEEWAGYFPSLSMRTTGGRMYGDTSTSRGLTFSRGASYSWLWEGSLTVSQDIFDGFETINRVGAADSRRISANFNIIDVRENLGLQAVISYLDVMRGEEAVASVKDHKNKIADYIDRITKMVDQGAADESMIVQARDIQAQLDNTLNDLQGQLKSSYAAYNEVIGKMPDGDMEMPVPRLDLIPETVDKAVENAMQHHPLLKSAEYTASALGHDADAAKQAYFPDVIGEVSYLKRDQIEELGGETRDARALVRVNWDISLAGADIARVKKSSHRYAEGRAKRAETERQIEKEIKQAFSDLETAKKQQAILQERVEINEKLFTNYEAQFEGARINLLQLLQANNALFNTRLQKLNGKYRVTAANFAVLASLGKLQESLSLVAAAENGR